MKFLIIAYDGKDSEAGARRQKVRERHLAGVRELKKDRKHLYGGAILDDEGAMIGSMMVVDYPSKEILVSEWLDNEPYVTGNVWQEIEIKPFKLADIFLEG